MPENGRGTPHAAAGLTESAGAAHNSSGPPGTPLLSVRDLAKHFGPVRALDGVNLDLHAGDALGLIGDNGSGKSTFINLLSGVHTPTRGEIFIEGQPVHGGRPAAARTAGIETIYQDLSLCPDLTVAENFFLGREMVDRRTRFAGWLRRKQMEEQTESVLSELGIELPDGVDKRIGNLSGGQRQAVAVGRAIAWGSKVVLMDEPTAALAVKESNRVGSFVEKMAARNLGVILISHDLPQVHAVCSRIAVLRRGTLVADIRTADCTVDDMVALVTGTAADASSLTGTGYGFGSDH
jgi:D-xylose transport system ATP-binding protein